MTHAATFHIGEQSVTVDIHRSAGSDGAIVVQVDTDFEPDASDGSCGLRILLNDGDAWVGVPYAPPKAPTSITHEELAKRIFDELKSVYGPIRLDDVGRDLNDGDVLDALHIATDDMTDGIVVDG